jgi:hypothetical protein
LSLVGKLIAVVTLPVRLYINGALITKNKMPTIKQMSHFFPSENNLLLDSMFVNTFFEN